MNSDIMRVFDSKGELVLNNKVALLTGVSSGVGSAIAELLLENGVIITGTYNSRKKQVDAFLDKYGPGRFFGVCLDFVAKDRYKSIKELVSEVLKRCEGLDIVINVTGIWTVKPFLYETTEETDEVWNVNYWGPYEVMKITIPHMLKDGGDIVNVASTAGVKGVGQAASYSASKAALINLTMSLAEEFAPRGIKVNAISPGYTDTSALDKYFDGVTRDLLIKNIPLGRLCSPFDIAHAVLGILTNDYFAGANLLMPGGRL